MATIKPIAYIKTDFKEKFGIPRQSMRAATEGIIVFEPEYRIKEALRGIEDYNYLWLIFDFSLSHKDGFSPTVRPPRLGGNKRVGVFATRSYNRPNFLGLSSVKLLEVISTQNDGMVLKVGGADLLDSTPIYDIKPYIPYCDCHVDAVAGFAEKEKNHKLTVIDDNNLLTIIPEDKRKGLIECLADDPRPGYKLDEEQSFSMLFSSFDISFKVYNDKLFITKIINNNGT